MNGKYPILQQKNISVSMNLNKMISYPFLHIQHH